MTRKNQLSSILVLTVFTVFAVLVILVLLTGANVVEKLTVRDRKSYDYRTASQYISTRVRQSDRKEKVFVRPFGDTAALVFLEEIDGDEYETLVYCYDGYLRELFIEKGLDMDAEFGERILPIEAVHFADEESHIRADFILPDGQQETVVLALRCERRADYEE